MSLRFFTNFFTVFFLALVTAGPLQAQESLSVQEADNEQPTQNLIEVDVEAFQSEALKNFLKEYRLILQQAKLGVSDTLKKHREDYKRLKQEHLESLQLARQEQFPKVVLKRKVPKINQPPQQAPEASITVEPAPPPIPQDLINKRILDASRAPKPKEKRLSLFERQRLVHAENEKRHKTLRFQQSDLGRLKSEIEKGPLKESQAKLTQFSGKINRLLTQIHNERGKNRKAYLDLGNSYLESQRYLNSLPHEDRVKLTQYAPHSGTSLGSYELAVWTFKMALTRNPKDGDTNFLLGKIHAEMGNRKRALERARNAEHLFTKYRKPEKANQSRSFIQSLEQSLQTNF